MKLMISLFRSPNARESKALSKHPASFKVKMYSWFIFHKTIISIKTLSPFSALKGPRILYYSIKNYVELMAFEKSLFLNSLICLKAEPPKRTQENSVVTNSLPGSNQQSLTLITGKGKPAPHLNRLSRLLSLLLRAYLSFLKSFVFQKVFFSPSSSPIKAVHKPEILTISLCYICVCV